MVRNSKSLIDCMVSSNGMESVTRIGSGYVIGSSDRVRSGMRNPHVMRSEYAMGS